MYIKEFQLLMVAKLTTISPEHGFIEIGANSDFDKSLRRIAEMRLEFCHANAWRASRSKNAEVFLK